ncbi:uncharacterized protein PG986_006685 [Apiospora aurea]|uniref:CBM1 domain-containing protein n=1 Tax=Apiospora aurea TaxID=335848 RepID=A0ABR1QAS0_9PEZI
MGVKRISALIAAVALAQGSLAAQPVWGQCGGQGWTGDTTCESGSACASQNPWYFQCIPGAPTQAPNPGTTTAPPTVTTTTAGKGGGGGSQTTSVTATYSVDPTLPDHTIYRPVDMNAFDKLPVMVWGNGACSANSLSHQVRREKRTIVNMMKTDWENQNFLLEIASWGVIAIVSGTPNNGGGTTAQQMTNGITWAVNNAGKGTYAHMDTSWIAAAGMSCGGIEAYAQAFDSRVTAIGIFNSGQYDAGGTNNVLPRLTKPIFFFLVGPSDIAYNNGMRDYAVVPAGLPTWVGNYPRRPRGHVRRPKGGKFGTAGQHWARWVLRGDTSAASYFTGNGARQDGWTVESKSLNNLQTTPI